MAERNVTAKIMELFQILDAKQQHVFMVPLQLMVNDPSVRKMGPEELDGLFRSLSRKPSEAGCAA